MGKSKELAELGNAVTQSGGTTTFSDDTTAIVSTQSGSITLQNYAYATGFTYDLSNASQAHSVGTSSSAPTILKTGNVERMRIDASGRVTMPYQPAFSAYHSSNIAYNSIGSPIQFNTTRYNVGNHFNTSTYQFTAPVTGKYLANVSMHYMGDGAYTYQFLRFRVNGGSVGVEMMRQGTKGAYDVFGGSHIIHMNANDTLDVVYGDSGIDAGYFRSPDAFNSFEAMLIG